MNVLDLIIWLCLLEINKSNSLRTQVISKVRPLWVCLFIFLGISINLCQNLGSLLFLHLDCLEIKPWIHLIDRNSLHTKFWHCFVILIWWEEIVGLSDLGNAYIVVNHEVKSPFVNVVILIKLNHVFAFIKAIFD